MNEPPMHWLALGKRTGSSQPSRWLSCSMLIFFFK